MDPWKMTTSEGGGSHSPLAEVDVAFAALPAEARAALWFRLVEGSRMSEVAEMIGITEEATGLLAAAGAAQVLEHLRRSGWTVRVQELPGLLAALPLPEPRAGLEERLRRCFERYMSRRDGGNWEEMLAL
jgi:hypothetical protein